MYLELVPLEQTANETISLITETNYQMSAIDNSIENEMCIWHSVGHKALSFNIFNKASLIDVKLL